MFRKRLFFEWLGALAIGCALAGWAAAIELTERIDFQLQDLATSFVAGEASDEIVLVTVDDESLAVVGNWPWPRARHAELVQRLDAAGADAILLDILFLEPADAGDDRKLAAAMEEAGAVYLPHSFVAAPDAVSGLVPAMPIPPLQRAAAGIGHVALDFESDGAVRSIELQTPAGNRAYPHLTVQLYRGKNGRDPDVMATAGTGMVAPLVPLRPAGAYVEVKAADVLAGKIPDPFFAGRTVFVGATAQGLGDSYAVPWTAGRVMSGVEIQANLYQDLVENRFVNRVSMLVTIAFSIGAVLLLFVGFRYLRPTQLPVLAVLLGLGCVGIALALPRLAGLWVPPGAALFALVLSYPLWSWRRLAGVVDFLSRESANLRNIGQTERQETVGFDEIEREELRLEGLVHLVRDRFRFIRAVIRDVPDPIVVFDREGRSALLNESAERLFGEVDTGLTLMDLISASKGRLEQDGTELVLPGARVFTIAKADLDLTSQDAPAQIVQFHEVTAIRSAERERREMLEFLSHDMRSPQVAIISLAHDNSGDGGVDTDTNRMARIRAQARRTLKLADDFVQIGRMAALPLQRTEFDLAGIAEEAADRAFDLAGKAGVTIARDITDEPVYLSGDPAVIARMLDNLLSNAVKFSPEGATVTLSVDAPSASDEAVSLSVSDEGPGMPPERASDPFRRYGPGDRSRGPSSGLGLAFVAEAARKHDAQLKVESRPGEGTRFTVTFG